VDIESTIYIIVAALFVLSACLVIYGTIAKNRWGVNFRRLSCPNCGAQMPRVRTPASGSQAMWGGVTCPKCGCEMDKWGRRLTG
jgi:ribosomal protein S27AE